MFCGGIYVINIMQYDTIMKTSFGLYKVSIDVLSRNENDIGFSSESSIVDHNYYWKQPPPRNKHVLSPKYREHGAFVVERWLLYVDSA